MPLSDAEFLRELRKTFALEAEEYLQTIVRGLVDLERGDDPGRSKQIVEEVFRSAHSLKGAAHTVDMQGVGEVCHALENIFLALRNDKLVLQPQDYDTLQRTADAVAKILAAPDAPECVADRDVLAALDRIVGQEARLVPSARARKRIVPKPYLSKPRPLESDPFQHPGEARISAPERPSGDETGLAGKGIPPDSQTNAVVPEQGPPPRPGPLEPEPPEPGPTEQSETPTAQSCAAPALEAVADPGAEIIRVSAGRLDAILLRAEELVSIKLALEQRTQELTDLLALFGPWKRHWRQLEDKARRTVRKQDQAEAAATIKDISAVVQGWDWNQSPLPVLEERLEAMRSALSAQTHGAGLLITDLLESTKSVLMLPAATLTAALPRTVRNIARSQGKEAVLNVFGAEIEVDKRILERIKDPLIHLVRNCIDHGLEPPDRRRERGKPTTGTVSLEFSQAHGNLLRIVIADDGSGIDPEKVRKSALKRGLITPEEARSLDDQASLKLILRSGVSTSGIITDISGRGLGMAIVLEAVEALGGDILIQSRIHARTEFTITLPMFLAGVRGLLVRESDQVFALPAAHVESTLRVARDAVYTVEGRDTIAPRGVPVPLYRLGRILEMTEPPPVTAESGFLSVVLLQAGRRHMAFSVDEVLNEQEILIKGLGRQLQRVRNVSGAAVLGSGRVVPVLNVNDLLRSAVQAAPHSRSAFAAFQDRPATRRVLVAEDSITSRTLLKNILTAAGYAVRVAVDGAAAWSLLGDEPADVVVSDVEMPRMNGFELTGRIRSDKRTAHIPVVLVTSLESREDKERGIDVGADAYIVKSSFDQSNLLDVLRRLVG
ncbi:CheA signal transduction histidine kinase [Desulfonatronum zhilinae]|nr:CheA signal transduction histidine kinase [Desulfonatronum zhilinae]